MVAPAKIAGRCAADDDATVTTRANKTRGRKPEIWPVQRGAPIPRSPHVTHKRGKVKERYRHERDFFARHVAVRRFCGKACSRQRTSRSST